MSKQLVKEQLKALEQLESSGRVTGPRKNKRKKALSTDVTKIGAHSKFQIYYGINVRNLCLLIV